MADTLPATLLILYFIGQPPADPKGIDKGDLETRINWTLQSTSQVETRSPAACRAIGNQLIARMDKVNTMTVRAYCLCADEAGTVCPGTEDMSQDRDAENKSVRKAEKSTVEALGRPLTQQRARPRN
ncbi:hypothetical protein [Bradyrhizobium sp. NBAIM01]|uniref:hypothetical protein n=1 Tax=Bradyrhizobium sp. NBAIM01 TaxID=2793818 RepID=UPI001CD1FC81|nr:hypothetical protein [Bradyrhizobium sp. NBAIM01]MCA1510202.1 hypothetical protein [Bradyrhizobium sp. NBAIM01]